MDSDGELIPVALPRPVVVSEGYRARSEHPFREPSPVAHVRQPDSMSTYCGEDSMMWWAFPSQRLPVRDPDRTCQNCQQSSGL